MEKGEGGKNFDFTTWIEQGEGFRIEMANGGYHIVNPHLLAFTCTGTEFNFECSAQVVKPNSSLLDDPTGLPIITTIQNPESRIQILFH